MTKEWKNKLYYGDNLVWLRDHDLFPNESIDLIYLDPPFNSKADYNVIFKEPGGEKKSQAQIQAFDDTWHWEKEAVVNAINELAVKEPDIAEFIGWLGGAGDRKSTSTAAYLSMMAVRLIELHRVLKPTGSLYLHCDPTASHYLKLLLDRIFGSDNFRNEIIWKRTSSHSDSRRWGHVHDVVLFYSKSDKFKWITQYKNHNESYLDNFYRYEDPDRGRYRLDHIIRSASMGPRPNLAYEFKGYKPEWGWRVEKKKLEILDSENRIQWSSTGRPYLKRFLKEMSGVPYTGIWDDILPVQAQSAERLGYQTQKPLTLLERIIQASSDEGDIVLDPFCGLRHYHRGGAETKSKMDRHRCHLAGNQFDRRPAQAHLWSGNRQNL